MQRFLLLCLWMSLFHRHRLRVGYFRSSVVVSTSMQKIVLLAHTLSTTTTITNSTYDLLKLNPKIAEYITSAI